MGRWCSRDSNLRDLGETSKPRFYEKSKIETETWKLETETRDWKLLSFAKGYLELLGIPGFAEIKKNYSRNCHHHFQSKIFSIFCIFPTCLSFSLPADGADSKWVELQKLY